MRALGAVFFLSVCAYVAAALFVGLDSSETSFTAELVTVRESSLLQGIAIRREQPVCSPGEAELIAEDGKRVPAGSLVAVSGDENFFSPGSALFFSDTDGFEQLSPDNISALSADGLQSLLDMRPGVQKGICGRLVFDNVWYYAAFAEDGRLPAQGEECRILFEGFQQSVSARVISSDSDKKLIVLRLNQGGHDFLRLRKCSAELIFSEYKGLRLDKEAVQLDSEGNYFVYTLTAGLRESCAVDIIYTGDDFYLAALSPGADSLRPGSTVIVSQEEIHQERIPER